VQDNRALQRRVAQVVAVACAIVAFVATSRSAGPPSYQIRMVGESQIADKGPLEFEVVSAEIRAPRTGAAQPSSTPSPATMPAE
jgi:hypothetical protein